MMQRRRLRRAEVVPPASPASVDPGPARITRRLFGQKMATALPVTVGVGMIGLGAIDPNAPVHARSDGMRAVLASAPGAVGFETSGTEAVGGVLTGSTLGVRAAGSQFGVYGTADESAGYGVYGYASGDGGRGVAAGATGEGGFGVQAGVAGTDSFGIHSEAAGERSTAVHGVAHANESTGVHGVALGERSTGVFADASPGFDSSYALFAEGRAHVNGALTHSSNGFRIDHPLVPETHFLAHSVVESSEMKTVYDGVVVLDAVGRAEVRLPEWFEALNGDVRYQLTAIGAPAPSLHIAREMTENRFEIAGGNPGMRVSWMVTGVRRDAEAVASPLAVVEPKRDDEVGSHLRPELHRGERLLHPRPPRPRPAG
jgi:hypothetical protein